jgi:hypothetical protein
VHIGLHIGMHIGPTRRAYRAYSAYSASLGFWARTLGLKTTVGCEAAPASSAAASASSFAPSGTAGFSKPPRDCNCVHPWACTPTPKGPKTTAGCASVSGGCKAASRSAFSSSRSLASRSAFSSSRTFLSRDLGAWPQRPEKPYMHYMLYMHPSFGVYASLYAALYALRRG